MKLTCIYCESEPASEEHAFPACFGEFEGFPLLLNTICRRCNEKIGLAEQQLCRSGIEGVLRSVLGLTGRTKHEPVNPFERGSAGAPPIEFTARHPESNLDVLWEFHPEFGPRELRQIVFFDDEGQSAPLRVPQSIKTPAQLREHIRTHGEPRENASVFGEELNVLAEFTLKPQTSRVGEQKPSVVQNLTGKVAVTNLYFRAIAKVAFHYLLTVEDSVRGDEDVFAPIREFILKGGTADDFVTTDRKPIVATEENSGLEWGHLLSIERRSDCIQVRLQFFIGPLNQRPFTYKVGLASHPIRIGPLGHYLHYHQETAPDFPFVRMIKKGRFSGEAHSLSDIAKYSIG